MGAILIKDMPRTNCHDCGVAPGKRHLDGCDVERCNDCGGQRLSCGCSDHGDYQKEKWSGIGWEKARIIAEENNLFCKWDNGWVRCDKDDDGASHDLNEATRILFNK